MLVHSTGATSWNKSLGRRPFFNPVLAPSAFWGGVIFVYNIYFAYSKTRGMQQAGTSLLEYGRFSILCWPLLHSVEVNFGLQHLFCLQ